MINFATIVGRVGRKEMRETKTGIKVCDFSVATSKKYKTADGEQKEITTWHPVVSFSKLAEIAEKYVHVGDLVFVQGSISHQKAETGAHAGRQFYSIQATDIRFIPTGKKEDSHKNDKVEELLPKKNDLSFEFDGLNDDIPF